MNIYLIELIDINICSDSEIYENENTFTASQARGMPRKINRLAHYALSAAAQDQARCVTLQHMTQAVEEWQA